MKQILLILSIIILFDLDLFPQNIEKVIASVEKNNTTLIALRKSVEAERIGNKTGLFPANPEFEFNYLWGSPVNIGNRKDKSIFQSFDFPTAYKYRNQISDYKNTQTELEYERQYKSIMTQTRIICNKLIFHNAFGVELKYRIQNARSLANSYKLKFDLGESGILDYNKAQIYLVNLIKDEESNNVERNMLLSELMSLNGGLTLEFTDSIFQVQAVNVDFDQWFNQAEQDNPVLKWLKQEIQISRKNEKLNIAMSYPKFHSGYISEEIVGELYQGVTLGITIPILENKNTVKYAKAKTSALESAEADTKLQIYNELKRLHERAISLQNSLDDYMINLQKYDNSELLKKALEKGELSLGEYYYELTVYYESIDKLLTLKKNLNETIIELKRYQ